ncbi:NADH dehydrogenase [ubiquinone] 1 alpha subcomplex assembly factor 4 [Corythoichthys intestinalis]|uniref:NADH dehydrogenase [ubiquinone] 1 alpha subcomplex assembly factor 4 n=1 Tax=Corythoichthys intestinalis TaxID=161448 RepID=UPI0025A4E2F1|nr:NADH dehydrogenase [ubiquinone] 1 alpha subcomplex assembly factor 4 [Corythoichthys intestinalis]XP_061806834.1 NADH dehydrogenase [ubiquinone] 1 alpha subcomplex assembly factor 4-like [Nerophis lumbriciformis]
MGARVVRMIRNFNLENRIEREMAKEKPRSAPRHKLTPASSTGHNNVSLPEEDILGAVHQKNNPLLKNLKSVYVDSKDTEAGTVKLLKEALVDEEAKTRPMKFFLPGNLHGFSNLENIPCGKLTITEALKALSRHQSQPQIWTSQKISEEYSLNLTETISFLEFFIPFQIQIIPPKVEDAKQLKA